MKPVLFTWDWVFGPLTVRSYEAALLLAAALTVALSYVLAVRRGLPRRGVVVVLLLQPGTALVAGGREWELIESPGHDPHMLMLFDRAQGVLLSADALWENGFGVVFPEIAGEPGFDDVALTLDRIAALPVRLVVPGHGRVFNDVAAALQRARSRLSGFQRDPARHARHALKVLLKYHLMEEREQPLADLLVWARGTPMLQGLWERFAPVGMRDAGQWIEMMLEELVAAGALVLRDGAVVDV